MKLILSSLFALFLGVPSQDAHFVEVEGHRLRVEIAQTQAEWARGLMYRERLGDFEGMLFVGTQERIQSFWMKNTPLSLDILYISKNWEVVDIKANTTPLSEKTLPSQKPATHVLEIRGGRSADLGIKVGSKLTWIKPD